MIENQLVIEKIINNKKNTTVEKTSQQGTVRMMQEDFHGYIEGSDEQFGKLQSNREVFSWYE